MNHSNVSSSKYWAFISYSSKDKKWGQWLHKRLESYPIPKEFQGYELFDGAILGTNLRPVFRDRDELAGSSDLGPAILKALKESRFLIVLCSKNSAKSEWVNKEIADFKALDKGGNILALILDGEPNATSKGRPEDECFPPELRYPAEPLAGDLRKEGDGKERGFLKVIAGISQLDFDTLYRRHERAQARKRLIASLTALGLLTIFAGLSIYAWAQRGLALDNEEEALTNLEEARTQKQRAETNLIEANNQRERAETQSIIAEQNAVEAKQQEQAALKSADQARRNLAESHYRVGLEMKNSDRPFQAAGMWSEALKVAPDYDAARMALFCWLINELPFSRLIGKRHHTHELGSFHSFSSHGNFATYLNDEGIVSLLNTKTGTLEKIQPFDNSDIYIANNPHANKLIFLKQQIDANLKASGLIWDIESRSETKFQLDFSSIAEHDIGGWHLTGFSSDGNHLIGSFSTRLQEGENAWDKAWFNIPCVWEASSGQLVKQFPPQNADLADVEYRDGSLTAAHYVSWMGDEAQVLRLSESTEKWQLPLEYGERNYGESHSPYYFATISPDGNNLAIATLGDWIYHFQFEKSSLRGGSESISLWNKIEIPTTVDVYSATFSSDSRQMLVNTRFFSRLYAISPDAHSVNGLSGATQWLSSQIPFFTKNPDAEGAEIDHDFEGLGIETHIDRASQRIHIAEEGQMNSWELHQMDPKFNLESKETSELQTNASTSTFHIYSELTDHGIERGHFQLVDTASRKIISAPIPVEDFYNLTFEVNTEGTQVLIKRPDSEKIEEVWIDYNPGIPINMDALEIVRRLYGIGNFGELPMPMEESTCLQAIDSLKSNCALSVYLRKWAIDYRKSRN